MICVCAMAAAAYDVPRFAVPSFRTPHHSHHAALHPAPVISEPWQIAKAEEPSPKFHFPRFALRATDAVGARFAEVRSRAIRMSEPDDKKPPAEPDSLYTNPFKDGIEFDAVTITALLGLAIAFQFFVLANL